MPDTDEYAVRLDETFPLRERAIRAAISFLEPPAGSRGLDAGCGLGTITLLLANAVGPGGHVTGIDSEPAFVRQAERTAEAAALAGQASFHVGDVRRLPFESDALDWAWSVDCVGYAPMEPLPIIQELARVVRPGGRVALVAWSSQQLLPGYPLLEARLNATAAGIAPFSHGSDPASHFHRALGWFSKVGLQRQKAHTIATSIYAPLSSELKRGLHSLIEMRWPGVQPALSAQDWDLFQRLVQPASPDYVLNQPDYYGFFTYSMFEGTVARQPA